MTISTVQASSEALKTYFTAPVIKQLNEKSGPVFAAIKKKPRKAVGNKFVITMQHGRHGGIGARAETDDLPEAASRKNKQGKAEVKNLYARIKISDKMLKTSKDDRAAFADELTTQMKDITADANDMLRRNFCGSYIGKMASVASSTGSTITIADGTIEAFYEGQIVDVLNATTGAKSVTAQEIIDVDRSNKTITFAAAVTPTAGNIITLAGNFKNELTGLRDILTKDNTLYEIDRSTNKWFNPHIYDKYVAGAPSEFNSLWMKAAMKTCQNNSGEDPAFFVCSDGVELAYAEEQQAFKRNTDIKVVEGGYKLITYEGIPISAERYAESNAMQLLNLSFFELAQLSDWDWLDNDGSILSRIANKPAYEAAMALYAELICTKPNAQAIIRGIKESVVM